MIPSQKVGIDHATRENVNAAISMGVLRFQPAIKPRKIPRMMARICPNPMSKTVFHNLDISTSVTGRRSDHETPRLPRAH